MRYKNVLFNLKLIWDIFVDSNTSNYTYIDDWLCTTRYALQTFHDSRTTQRKITTTIVYRIHFFSPLTPRALCTHHLTPPHVKTQNVISIIGETHAARSRDSRPVKPAQPIGNAERRQQYVRYNDKNQLLRSTPTFYYKDLLGLKQKNVSMEIQR